MTSAEPELQHRIFSLRRVGAIARTTFLELSRLKVLYALLLFALLLIASSVFLARFSFQQEFQILKDVCLGAINLFSCLLAIVTTARLLPQELEDRTIYTVLAKPVSRFEYLLGKLAGVSLMLIVSLLVMSLLFFTVLYLREQSVLAETRAQLSGSTAEQISEASASIAAAAFTPSLGYAIAVIAMKALLLAALTLFISTFATSNAFTVIVMVMIYLIGHLQGIAREAWVSEGASVAARVFLAVVALIFPDLAAFNLVDGVVTGEVVPVPLVIQTVGLGAFYVLIYFLLAAATFYGREL